MGRKHKLEPTPMPVVEESKEAAPLYNSENFGPNYLLQKEQLYHRHICHLLATGMTNAEIAQQEGWSLTTINNVAKQPWAMKLITELMDKMGKKVVLAQLHGKAADAAKLLMDAVDPTNPLALKNKDRVAAANEYLDRCWGKATQPIEERHVEASELSDDELAKIASGRN